MQESDNEAVAPTADDHAEATASTADQANRANADEPALTHDGADQVARTAIVEQLQQTVLGGPPSFTSGDIAATAQMSMDEVRKLWRAMGFPDAQGATAFTDADLSAVLRVGSIIERGILDYDSMVEVARSLGQTMARLADWQVDAVGRRLEDNDPLGLESGLTHETMERIDARLDEVLPEFEQLLTYAWRRQIAATIARRLADLETGQDGDELVTTATVGFADLVSFTRLSKQMDEQALSSLVHTFETVAADIVHSCGARLIKTLGDEVMFVAPTAAQAAEIGLQLHEMHQARPEVPQMRVGLATGVVLARMGDVYGNTVNRASRLTATARPGTTLIDPATHDALQLMNPQPYSTRGLAPRPVRSMGLVRLYALSRNEKWLKAQAELRQQDDREIAEAGDPVQSAEGYQTDAASSAE